MTGPLPGGQAWSDRHHGRPVSPATGVWVSAMQVLARPFIALRIPALAVTLLGLACAWAAPLLAALGEGDLGRALQTPDFLAAGGPAPDLLTPTVLTTGVLAPMVWGLILLSGLLDGVDGTVASALGQVSDSGAAADRLADRLSEAAYLLTLALLGAPGWACVLTWLATLAFERRSQTISARGKGLAPVTVAERPTRLICTAMFALAAGWGPALDLGQTHWWAAAGVAVWLVLLLIGDRQRAYLLARR